MGIAWDRHEAEAKKLYIIENKSAKDTVDFLNSKYGINITLRQLKYKFANLKKVKATEWRVIHHEIAELKSQGKFCDVFINGRRLDPKRVERERRRYLEKPSDDELLNIDLGFETVGQHRIEIRRSSTAIENPTLPSDSTPTQSSRRSPTRPRRDDDNNSQSDQGFDHESPFSDIATSTGPLPARPHLHQTPNLSSTSSTPSSSAQSTSPVERSTLQLLKKPVLFVPINQDPTDQLADDILPTYDRIIDIGTYNSFLPRAIEQDIKAKHRGSKVKPHWFFDHTKDENTITKYMQEFEALQDIEKVAKACQTEGGSEAAWNVDVHAPLLKLGFAPFPSLTCDILTHARISKPFIPEMQANSSYNFAASKMINWSIRVRPSPDTSEQIRKVLSGLPDNECSINQTTYGPVRFDPIAVSIETKIAIGAIEEARMRLGLCVAAWHKRVSALSHSARNGYIITLPLILVIEHEWHLLLAFDRGDKIVTMSLFGYDFPVG
ncbi:hypothetical protein BGZ63DRAFT_409647 [Mariannaea sp. PMI_226]|nr:hypothetical protein BGZ63DRAFT_409647 [Mariannaea sp. PMI_226]